MRYFIGLLAIVFIVLIGVLIFGGGGKKTPKGPTILPLTQYANTDASVSLTINGQINGDDAHRVIKITVDKDSRELDIIQGYSGHVLSANVTYNTPDAYRVFLRALDLSSFTSAKKPTSANADPMGQCPDGLRYVYQLNQNGNSLVNLWSTNCPGSLGNFNGNAAQVTDLFEKQITNYETLTENVAL
ncbi:MAG TPA: hypothetical protein VFP35_01880 [Candidatus Saccharimonadales bacterium]|nr:hypothetical protein [Candidatus Saccharimonadales bacterium]